MSSQMISDEVAELQSHAAEMFSSEVLSAFAGEQSALAAAGVPKDLLQVGSLLPDIDLLDAHGVGTTLYEAIGGRPAVIVLYRGAWCPYCNIALNNYQAQLLPELNQRGVGLIAVSPQTPDGSLTMQEKNNLSFTVLSDPGNKLARLLGVLTAPSADTRAAQLELGLDLTTMNADGTTALPMPTALIVDTDHLLRWLDVHPDYSTRSEARDILAALDTLT